MSNVVTNSSIRKDILHIAFPVLFIQLAVFGRIFIATYVISQVNAHATAAFAIGIGYGAMRSAMALLNFRVRSVDDLKRLHRRLDHVDGFIRWAGAVAVGAGTIGAIAL